MLSILLTVIMVISMLPTEAFAAGDWNGQPAVSAPAGSGTKEAPYLLADAADLKWFADSVNSSTKKSTATLCAELENDIDLSGQAWTPIGYYDSYSDCVYYGGVFDGNGYSISGLDIDNAKQYQALFGYVKNGTIKNLTVRGLVRTSTSGSAYAAGIVGYGYPVVLENCTNEAEITATAKGYAAGVVAYASSGSRIENCTNKGNISGSGDYVGGIVATAMKTELHNCFNSGSIVDTGKPSSYAYSVGGIAGSASSASLISMCGNTGTVTSTLKRTGGIVGSLAGTVEKCFNTGNVTGIYGVGGIVGDSADKATVIASCYNTGNVKGTAPTAVFSDTNAKGVGGIIGGVSGNSYKAEVSDCYNAGTVTLSTTDTTVLAGGIIGNSSGKNYSGVETTGLIKAENCYYLDTCAAQGDGHDAVVSGIEKKTKQEMQDALFAEQLGADYINNEADGYPLLGWQDPDALYPVAFTIAPEGAKLVVKDENGNIAEAESGTTYRLKNGAYSYEVTGEECEPAVGSFTVAYGGQSISVSLNVKKYDYVFTTDPEAAALVVTGQTPLADGRTYQLAKAGNPYNYTVTAYGYEQSSGSFCVTGDASADQMAVVLKKQPVYQVVFPVEKEEGGKESDTQILVTSDTYPEAVIEPQADGSFALPNGTYAYKVSSAGYKTVSGSFTVDSADLTLPKSYLEIQTAWDGTTKTEPAKDSEGVYLITTPDELMWFHDNGALTDSARLMADIQINDAQTAYSWTPIGTGSSKAYTGTFDGNGYTLSGMQITSTSTSNIGLFGYVGADGTICNLTMSDSVLTSNGKYVGGIAGDLKGRLENCHITDTVEITGKAYVGGIVGELDNGASVSGCSNAGTVTGTGTTTSDGYIGGIAGRVYSNLSNALTDSFNSGIVTGSNAVGGIAGTIYNGGTIKNVYNIGSVTATNVSGAAGGIVGNFRAGSIYNAYTIGAVSAAKKGTVAGMLEWSGGSKTVSAVYGLDTISDSVIGNENGCKIQSGTIQICTSAELKNMADALGDAFYEDERIVNEGYPILAWQAGVKELDPDAPAVDPEGWNGKTASKAPVQIDGVYQISTPAELKWFAKAAKTTPDIKGILTADIDLNNQPWSPIGGTTADTAFTGSLNGNGKTVCGLYMKSGNAAGLFAYNSGEIKNLTIRGLLKDADNAAAAAAYNVGRISGVTAEVTITGGNHIAGITANNMENGTVIDCSNTAAISGGQYVGGIAASNKGTITDSKNSGAITGSGAFVAGVAADNDGGIVKDCANSGQIIGKAAILLAYVSGVVGRNDGTAENLYNAGNVVALGSSVGGCVGINTSGSTAKKLYNVGDVCGSYIDTEDGEEFRVGGAIGEVNSGVSEAYYAQSLAITTGGTAISTEALMEKAGAITSLISGKSNITGTAALGDLEALATAEAVYTGNAQNPVYVWYITDGYDETVLAVSDCFEIPANMVGYVLQVKVMDPALSGIIVGKSGKIEGFTGSVKLQGYPIVGYTLTAVYTGTEETQQYQWYRGTTKIEGANSASYTVTEADHNQPLTVRVTGSRPGYIEKKTGLVQTGAEAGVWAEAECAVPKKDAAGNYLISTEAELKWFVSFVNSGNTTANAKLTADITLQTETWYPIGNSKYPYEGTFDGNDKTISNFVLTASADEQGFFGNIGGKGVVEKLNVTGNVTVTGDGAISTGGIAGYLEGKITNCTFSGIVMGVQDVGGIVGQSSLNSVISQCSNQAVVTGKESIGGIVGSTSYGNVEECVNTGKIGAEGAVNVGGIAGSMANYAVVTASYNTGAVAGKDYLGGIAGKAYVCAAPQGCYNAGSVETGIHAFGVLGDLSGTAYISTVTGSYYLTESAQTATDKTATGVNEASMKKAAFVSLLNGQAGKTSFVMDLKETNSGYPILLWQTGNSSGNTGEVETPEEPESITVTFTLRGDTAHGVNGGHTAYTEWVERTTCVLPNGATAYDLFKKMMNDYGLSYEVNGNSYVSSITGPKGVTLAEFTNGPRSGWMYTINDKFPDYMAAVKLKDGDDMLFFYTDDYKDTNWNPSDPAVAAVEQLIYAIGKVTLDSGEKIETARDAYELLTDVQKLTVENYSVLLEAERIYEQLLAAGPVEPDLPPQTSTDAKLLENIYKTTGDYLLKGDVPGVSSVGGEWVILGLGRSDRISEAFKTGYYENVVYTLRTIGSEKLHRAKSTENSRVIIALTALGYDVTNVDGKNLLAPLADMDYILKQGINGPIWALIAFDTADYEIPAVGGNGTQATRESLIQTILSAQQKDGGWDLGDGVVDVDTTAMAIQALAPYYKENQDVRTAVNQALTVLSDLQNADGGFTAFGSASSESCAQVIVALTSLGMNPNTDARFIKNGKSVLDALAAYYVSGGGFRHTLNGEVDAMATEQGYYALVSYYRLIENKTSLYDMLDVEQTENPVIDRKPVQEPDQQENPGDSGEQEEPEKDIEGEPDKTDIGGEKTETVPKTGDQNDMAFYMLLLLLSVTGLTIVQRRKETVK